MSAGVFTQESELKEQPQCELGDTTAENPQELSSKSEKSNPKVGKQKVILEELQEKKVKPTTKAAPANKKSNKKGRPSNTKKLSRRERNQKSQLKMTKRPTKPVRNSARKRKENEKFQDKKKRLLKTNGEKGMLKPVGKIKPRQIPLVLPSAKSREGIVRSSVKYTLKRAESNREHVMRVISNKRKFGRRNRTKTRKKQSRQNRYLADYWKEPEVRLDELSSLDCGSYSDNVEKLSTSEEVETVETENPNTIPSDFVFNVEAPEFIPKSAAKKRANIFTFSELLESVKGQQLPSMPQLDRS